MSATQAIDWTKYEAPATPQIDFSKYENYKPQYAPGRAFGMDVARGMGLDADKIAAAEDAGGQGEGLKEIGSQVLEGIKGTLKDPLLPFSSAASNLEDAIKSGSPGKIVGSLSLILGSSEGADKAPGVARDAVANAARDETGNLRPGVKVAARAAGGVAGHMTGIPGAEIAGVFSGPSLADALIPSREATVGKAVPIRTSPYFNPEEYRAGQKGLPAGQPTPFEQPQAIVKQAAAEVPAKFSEGRPATWTNELVRELAGWGDPDAIEQAKLRGFGRIPLKYSEVQVNPRQVIHFDAAGNPQ